VRSVPWGAGVSCGASTRGTPDLPGIYYIHACVCRMTRKITHRGETEMAKQNLEMDQDIPQVRQWVEERTRHYLRVHGRQGKPEVIRHPKQDVQGVLVRVPIKGQTAPAKLTVLEVHAKFDRPLADHQIERFIRDHCPPLDPGRADRA